MMPSTERTNVPKKLHGVPFKKGHDPRRGVSPGRPSDEFTAQMRALASADEVLAGLRAILSDHNHPHFLRAFAYVADRGYGRPQESLDVTSNGRSITEILHEARGRVARMRDGQKAAA